MEPPASFRKTPSASSQSGTGPELRYYELGNSLIGQRRLEEAAAAYRQALALHPRFAAACTNLGTVLTELRRFDEAVAVFRQAIAINPALPEAHNSLGTALLALDRPRDAAAAFRAAIALRGAYPEAHYNLGNACAVLGQWQDAAAAFRQALAARPRYPQALNNLGNAFLSLRRIAEAADAFRAAIAAHEAFPEAHCNLAGALAKLGQEDAALAAYRRALVLYPHFPHALYNLSTLLLKLNQPEEAVAVSTQAVAVAPDAGQSHYHLGNALRESGRKDEALAAYRRAVALKPDDADHQQAVGDMLLPRGQRDEAYAHFRRAHELRPLVKFAADRPDPAFSIVMLTAPGPANTASEFLITGAAYDSHFFMLLPGIAADPDALRPVADVVVNLISDVDWAGDVLPAAADLVDRLGRPVLNHPRKILATGRDSVAARLSGIPGLRMPKTLRLAGADLVHGPGALDQIAFPILLRVSGTHGGEEFEKFDDAAAALDFARRKPDAAYYLSEYVPYESADGYFRKYRLIYVAGAIFPYHLAIDRQWKVHHFRTDMSNQEWMRQEEETFVRNPRAVFGDAQWQALQAICAAIGLDYFGVDCALDQNGDVVVFEVNATMLVHGERGIFAYKQPYIARIREAFSAMLTKAVAGKAS